VKVRHLHAIEWQLIRLKSQQVFQVWQYVNVFF
jgi:hypothetical protein